MQTPSQYAGGDLTATATGGIDHAAGLPLNEAFVRAITQNEAYYVARHGGARYTSPLFKFVQCLKAHPGLKGLAASEAFQRITNECHPNWGNLFPHVQIPSLEFVTAWDQVQFPVGVSPWDVARERVTTQPLILLDKPPCEGYEHYLGVGFHLQRITPRWDIMLPVKPVSGLLTGLMGKDVSEQSVSGYCRLAMANGYLARTAKPHHPSGKAARYRFDLTRFTEAGVEMEHRTTTEDNANGFSHGCHGIEGNEGTQGIYGSSGIEDMRSSGGLSPAVGEQGNATNTKQGRNTARNVKVPKPSPGKSPMAALTGCASRKKRSTRKCSIPAIWQAFMFSQAGWQDKLSNDDFELLLKFGRKTDEFARLILSWTLKNWDEFASRAVGTGKDWPAMPIVAFFCTHQAVAYNLWREHDLDPEECEAFAHAAETSIRTWCDLETIYSLGEEALVENVIARSKDLGLLVKCSKGWEVCGKAFTYITEIADRYQTDKEFASVLREAVAVIPLKSSLDIQ